MDYPDNFETPAFPVGKCIAISRVMAIWTLISFLIMVFLCGILIWSSRSDRLIPFVISANSITGEWKIVGKSGTVLTYSAEYAMQESLVGNFVKNWFGISTVHAENEAAWKKCDREICNSDDGLTFGARQCAIFCNARDEVFSRFYDDILPGYEQHMENGEAWSVNDADITISPAGIISGQGGTWRVTAIVSAEKSFEIIAFVKVAKDNNSYPKNMGFYIADFNSYRID